MHFKLTGFRVGISAGALTLLLGIGALAATASTSSRHALLEQLQSSAPPGRTASGLQVVRRPLAGYLVTVALTPNQAGGPNGLSVQVAQRGVPVTGARVTASFSMPSMNMWNGYKAALAPAGRGRYGATVPVLGMAGRWWLAIKIAPGSGPAVRTTVIDVMSR